MSERTGWEEQAARIEESLMLQDEAFKAQAESSRTHAVAMSAFVCEVRGRGGTPTRLYGGREVTLCNTHKNGWHDFVVDEEAWQRKLEAEARYMAAVHSGEEERAILSLEALNAIMLECYELSGEWLEKEEEEWQE